MRSLLYFRYESLLQEELVIAQEVVAFEKRLESWLSAEASHQMTTGGAAAVAQKSRAVEPSAVPPAVIALEVVCMCRGCGHREYG